MSRMCALVLALSLLGCAQVPKKAVTLSATVGKDLVELHKAHRELALLMFEGMRRDINRFIDDVYAPHQVKFVMDRQWELARSSDPKDRKMAILLALNAALAPDASAKVQENVLKAMKSLVTKVREDIDEMRMELLTDLHAQQVEVLGTIDRNYQKIHYANSIVTGHLASVAEVHDAQEKALRAIGIVGLREKAGLSIANASDRIGQLVETAEKASETLDQAERFAVDLKETVKNIGKSVEIATEDSNEDDGGN